MERLLNLSISLTILLLSISVSCVTNAQEEPGKIQVRLSSGATSSSSKSWGNQWSSEQTFDMQGVLQKLPEKVEASAVAVKWFNPTIDELGQVCTISGKLLMGQKVENREPMKSPQFVAVHLSITPGKTPNWSKGVDSDTVDSNFCQLDDGGKFKVRFDLRPLKLASARSRNVQVGATLARQSLSKSGTLTVRLTSDIPVPKNTISTLTIPNAKQLPKIIQLIDKASGWPDEDSTAIELIRAANALRKLKRNDALDALEKYAQLTSEAHGYDFEDSYVIYALIQCVFEPAHADDSLPHPKYFRSLAYVRQNPKLAKAWPREPMVIAEDIPWLLGSGVSLSGVPFNPLSDLRWVRRNAVLRDSPLRPADNPLLAAHRLMLEPRFTQLSEYPLEAATSQLKEYSHQMVAEWLPDIPLDSWDRPNVDDNWEMLLEASKEAGLRWDESKQAYTIKDLDRSTPEIKN
jgi:hypothetical protein